MTQDINTIPVMISRRQYLELLSAKYCNEKRKTVKWYPRINLLQHSHE